MDQLLPLPLGNFTVLGKRPAEESNNPSKIARNPSGFNFTAQFPRELITIIIDHLGEWKTARILNKRMLNIADERVVVWMSERSKVLRPASLTKAEWFYQKFGSKLQSLTLTRFSRSGEKYKIKNLSIFTSLCKLTLDKTSLATAKVQDGYFNERSLGRLTSLTVLDSNFGAAVHPLINNPNTTNIKVLQLSQNKFDHDKLHFLLLKLPQLESLKLSHESVFLGGAHAIANSGVSCLTELKLASSHIPFEGLAMIVSSPSMVNLIRLAFVDNVKEWPSNPDIAFNTPHLTDLDLSENLLCMEVINQIAEANLSTLRVLNLRNTGTLTPGVVALARSRVITHLTTLILDKNPVGDEGTTAIVQNQTSLRQLSLEDAQVGISGLTSLVKANLPLVALNLAGNELRTKGAEILATFSSTSLTYLNVNRNRFYQEGAKKFLTGAQFPELITLKIGQCQVHESHEPFFKRFPKLRNLSWDKLT